MIIFYKLFFIIITIIYFLYSSTPPAIKQPAVTQSKKSITTYNPSSDVITMVSLISPTESEDEQDNKDKDSEKDRRLNNKNDAKQISAPNFDPSIFANRRLGSLRRIGKSGKFCAQYF